jgi:hypothetical protein
MASIEIRGVELYATSKILEIEEWAKMRCRYLSLRDGTVKKPVCYPLT